MHTPSKEQLTALNTLRNNPQFELFCDWIGDWLEKERDANDALDGVLLYRGQGTAQTLKGILEVTETAAQQLARIHVNASRQARRERR